MDIWAINPRKQAALAGKDVSKLRQPSSLDHLTKSIQESTLTVLLPFGSDPELRAQYVNKWGMLRVGKLLEELDAFAGTVAYKHCDDDDPTTGPLTLVTASLDRLDLLQRPLRADTDYTLTGAVTFSGKSSMNVDVELSTWLTVDSSSSSSGDRDGSVQDQQQLQKQKQQQVPVMQASTTFVARNKENKAVSVPRIVPANAREEALFDEGKRATEARKIARKTSLLRAPPTADELQLVHTLFMQLEKNGGILPQHAVYVGDTATSTSLITMPQDRNLHGKVFGGYLMRKAFETAFTAGWKLTGVLPSFVALDDIAFYAPVETGAVLSFDAKVTYAAKDTDTYAVSVSALMEVPTVESTRRKRNDRITENAAATTTTGATTTTTGATASVPGNDGGVLLTNEFHFVFRATTSTTKADNDTALSSSSSLQQHLVPTIYPRTYAEAMGYIHAYRRHEVGQALAASREKAGGAKLRFL